MRSLRRTFSLASLALVVVMLAVEPASAQETPVTVVEEPSGVECSPCLVHLVGESHVISVPTGADVLRCEDEFAVRLYGDGSGEMEWLGLPHGGPTGCSHTNCIVNSPHWTIRNSAGGAGAIGELGGGMEHLRLTPCVRLFLGGFVELQCNVEIAISATGTAHQYRFTANQLCGSSRRYELDAISEGTGFELVHAE